MALQPLKLDLAPPSTLWRQHHAKVSYAALAAGALVLACALTLTLRAYRQASRAGREASATLARTRGAEDARRKVVEELRTVDVTRELPRWRLAERILTERSLPWSRLTAELERTLVVDVRLKSLQRTRGADQKVQIKVKGEALSREAEIAFVEALQKNPFFEEVILEREAARQGGGVEFDYTLAAFSVPPPYAPLPRHGPPLPQSRVAPSPEASSPPMPRKAAGVRPGHRPQRPIHPGGDS